MVVFFFYKPTEFVEIIGNYNTVCFAFSMSCEIFGFQDILLLCSLCLSVTGSRTFFLTIGMSKDVGSKK